ncbi:YbaK/EbsC family protein [Proteiniclasticum sp. SCR006]|uniref:YbaK/EbsC family protein n=1 Tax=Proteiniclasticum aestuarii TaxID=2817862 RepID=A0A939H5R1_9CLOT|nr:YbaK/EbsC family protein [Proteiniclasticum aestuarii]MBO1264684.1 YbaK/EbsC family protein [Proteiniclasticum aestuarii]
MAIENVKRYFRKLGMEDQVMEFPVSSATVELAAEAAGVIPGRIAKTLSFYGEEGAVLIVAAGDARVDSRKFKERFRRKAKMLRAEDVEKLTGHAVGGVCPFAVPEDALVFLDLSLKRYESVFPACGSDNSAIELTPEELFRYAKARGWVDVCKHWEE